MPDNKKRVVSWKFMLLISFIISIITPFFWDSNYFDSYVLFNFYFTLPIHLGRLLFGLFNYLNWLQFFGKLILSASVLYIFKVRNVKQMRNIVITLLIILFLFALYFPTYYFITPEGRADRFRNSLEEGMAMSEVEVIANSLIPEFPKQDVKSYFHEPSYNCIQYGGFLKEDYDNNKPQWYEKYGIFAVEDYLKVCYDSEGNFSYLEPTIKY